MGVGPSSNYSQFNAGTGQFPGTQGALNNAIGAENYLATGGAANQAGGLAQTANQYGQNAATAASNAGANILSQAQGYGNQLMSQKNPYLDSYYNAAALPMTQNYQNTVAPNILANAAQTGTLGGTGESNAFGLAESGLAQGLGTLGASIYEPAWAQSQNLAANIYGQGLASDAALKGQGLSTQAALQGQGLGLQGQGLGLTQSAISNMPSLASGAYIPSQELMQSGALGQGQAQNALNTGYQNLQAQGMWPYTALNQLGSGLGNYPQGGGTSTTTQSGGGSIK